ncbi:MAG: LysE family translocator [Phenylobacterium sp.]|uniref:LysE family translocator n=1 Tax=Phenylobacterium sp. TaxID=1871053 RepID=UPI001A387D97|nr:LysE family translocator [Phenylobacterium sp.]MBL8555818.1 LysE family translocator [Phenylobacterium sp.]
MTVIQALLAFSVAAALLTITPGLDTAMVLRTAAVEGPKRAALAALGIMAGCFLWGAAVALGLGVLLAASSLAFTVLKWAGAAYLVWLGIGMILKPRERFDVDGGGKTAGGSDVTWMRRGFLTNLLNPKIGVFYVSFLPQFLPQTAPAAPFIFLLVAMHCAMSVLWFAGLIAATRPLAGALQKAAVVRWLDRLTGGVFLAFGVRLALERR